jgi:DNA excision repair protein ERCC-2
VQLDEIFPYDSYRTGQRELAKSVYNNCKRGNRLVVEAMSGFGKTSSVLAGSILAAEEDDTHVIYACRTKRQVFRVMEEIQRIQARLSVGAVQLFAKIDYCLLKETSGFGINQESFKWYCSFNTSNNLCSYFLNLGLLDRQTRSLAKDFSTSLPTHSQLLNKCRSVHLCPYEVMRLAILTSRVVVTTYHYLLDESMRSLLLGTAGWEPSHTIVIIDEAHNLRDFMRSSSMTKCSFSDLQRALDDARSLYLQPVASFLEGLKSSLINFHSRNESWHVDKANLLRAIKGSHDDAWLPNLALELSTCAGIGWQSISGGRNLPTSIMKVGTYLNSLLSPPEGGTTIVKSEEGFSIVDTNPARRFVTLIRDYRSLILLSATISPSNLFMRSVGLDENTPIHRIDLQQKFNVRTVIDTGVSTRFKLRGPLTYSRIADKIRAIAGATKGSIGIFVPSYTVMESFMPFLSERLSGRKILSEDRNLSNVESERIMSTFKSNPGSVLLAVQGARFSEGEDFPGDQMDVSVVVGFSLPPPTPVMYAEYSDSQFSRHDTYLIVSLLPAVRKAIQAAGRHIRSPDKKGMVFLMDIRFNQPEILRMIPDWMKRDRVTGDFGTQEIGTIVRDFFGGS